jgi:hypothetical protein
MTARTYSCVPVNVTVAKKSAARMASAWERRNAAQGLAGAFECRIDPGVLEDLPDGGGGDLDPEDE